MQITFRNRKLEKLCNSDKEMRGKLGLRMADKLQQRLNELTAVETLDEMRQLTAARCHELSGNLKGKLAVDLVHPDRLIFSPDNHPLPTKEEGGLDWCRVTAICVDGVGDYH